MTSVNFSLVDSLRARLQDPMRRGADALIIGTGITSVLGLVFWALAARWLPTSAVGIGAALISTVALLANFATLGMRNGLLRFLPAAGSGAGRLILSCYAICAGAALLAAGIFLVGQPWWAEKLSFLRENPLSMVVFAVGTAAWVIFVLQDQVLIGLRHAGWVPLANGVSSLLKILALPLVATATVWAIFAATLIPALLAIGVVGAVVLRYVRRTAATDPRVVEESRIPLRQLVGFAAPDHVATLLWLATTDVLTLMVLHVAGAEASAYWYMADTIGYALYLITSNVGSALLAEAVHDPARSVEHARRGLLHRSQLVVPAPLVGVLPAPFVLRLIGPDYAENATTTLQLILISAIPQLIIGISVSTARVRGDMRTVLGVYMFTAFATWSGSWIGLAWWGLTGVGIAVLVNQVLVATYLVLSGRTGLWDRQRGWRNLIRSAEKLPQAMRSLRTVHQKNRLVHAALEACGLSPDLRTRLLISESDTVVLAVEGTSEPLVLKIATTESASRGLGRHREALEQLGKTPDTYTKALLPHIICHNKLNGHLVVLETALPGQTGTTELSGRAASEAAFRAISSVHRATGESRIVDDELLSLWIDGPLEHLLRACTRPGARRNLQRFGQQLRRELHGRRLETSLVHGDFWTGNVLTTPAFTQLEVSGIVDWENAVPVGLPETDFMHWWLTNQPCEMGTAVCQALQDPGAVRSGLLRLGMVPANNQVGTEHIVLLTWLWHVAAGLTRASRNRVGRVWLSRNVAPVVRLFTEEVFRTWEGTGK